MILNNLLRDNIRDLKPYSSARDEFSGREGIFLDANEIPFNDPLGRYPDPYQQKLKERIGNLLDVEVNKLFLGNGSDEAIDLIFRCFCEPAQDNVIAIAPSYGMYRVAADINNVEVRDVELTTQFQIDVSSVLSVVDKYTKAIFLCSPNNPTGNCLNKDDLIFLFKNFNGLVVVDEAYIDFAIEKTILPELSSFPNLVVLRTFSKAWGLAGVRLGMAFASADIIAVFNKVKYPYNVNKLTQEAVLNALDDQKLVLKWIEQIIVERSRLAVGIQQLSFVKKVYPSDANFLLVKVDDADLLYSFLLDEEVIVRNRNGVIMCDECLRISIGTTMENEKLMTCLKMFENRVCL